MAENVQRSKNSWKVGFLTLASLRDILIVLVLGVTFWKLLASDLSLSLEDFQFADFLSMFLALFAVSLAVAFYFKATATSNQFYDNVYKFTRDVSEILGRIEAGFGERLRHLDEGYSGLRDRFENLPLDLSGTKKKAQEEEAEIQRREEEFQEIVSELMERARLAEGERTSLMERFEEARQELELSKRELRRLQHRIHHAESYIDDVPKDFVEFLANALEKHLPAKYRSASPSLINRRFSALLAKDALSEVAVNFMMDHGLLDEEKDLTPKGLRVVRRALGAVL